MDEKLYADAVLQVIYLNEKEQVWFKGSSFVIVVNTEGFF